MRPVALRILLPLACFAALALLWSYPLVLHLSDRLPGEVAGDNLSFLWNLWWMRQAGTRFFFTPLLFAPFGTDLALDTHTALQATIAATLLRGLSVVTAQNVIIIGTLALNGFAAYLLALDRTRSVAGALAAGVVFGGSAYVAAHLLGHFSLISVWSLPLVTLGLLRTFERRSLGWSILTGLSLVATAGTDYYYTVYAIVIAAGLVLAGSGLCSVSWRRERVPPTVMAIVGVLLAVIALLSVLIGVTGGFDSTYRGVRVRATEAGNLLTIGWLLIGLTLWLRFRPRIHLALNEARSLLIDRMRLLAPAVVVFAVGVSPILLHAAGLWRRGDYVAPPHLWRSGPAGIDLATLLLGSPLHPLTGAWTSAVYARLGIDPIEEMGWIGVVPVALLIWGLWRARSQPAMRWTVGGGLFFFVWALGPWLRVAGMNAGLMLPANLFGLIPIVSNARMPGRALAVTLLAASLLAARLLADLSPRRRLWAALGLSALVTLDSVAAPFPLIAMDPPPHLYSTIATGEPGAVLELPMGMRDGFEQIGAFDDRTLQYQMVHGHPLVGGFSARIAPSIKQRYGDLPVVRSLLRLSDPNGGEIDPRDAALDRRAVASALRAASIRFVVIDRSRAMPALLAYVTTSLPLTPVMREGERELFRVED
jgi:hypothetical protein